MGMETLLVSAMVGLVQSELNRDAQDEANYKQFQQNKKLMQYQNELQMKTWSAQQDAINEYNKPVNQISRLTEAGINPNSIGDVQGNYSNVSPEASIGLGSTNPQAATSSIGDVFRDLADKVLQGRGLDIQQQDADTRKSEAESSIRVQSQTIKNMLLEKDLTEAQRDEVRKRISQMDEQLRLKADETMSVVQRAKADWARVAIEDYNSQWQEEVERSRAATYQDMAVSQRKSVDVAARQIRESARQFDERIKLDRDKYNLDFKRGNVDQLLKVLDQFKAKINIGNLLETNYHSIPEIAGAVSFIQAYQSNFISLPDEAKLKLAPEIDSLCDSVTTVINSVKFQHSEKRDNTRVDSSWKSPYINSRDVDGSVPDSSYGY